MNPFAALSYQIRRALRLLFDWLAQKWQSSFYLYLAAIFSVFIIADTAYMHLFANMKQGAFDMMVRYRLNVPAADKDIVIVDINEASLAAMAKDYGRWPWPRQVLGEFLEQIEQQQPKAVVFDILFSDADIYNPDSDIYFDSAIASTTNTFFPLLRLDPDSDPLSKVKPSMIPGVRALSKEASQDATVAVVLPHFQAALNGGRIGLHNIYPDPDGVARQYLIYRDDYGWRLPSLPAQVAHNLGWEEPSVQRILLNWRGKPFSYHYVSFSDVFVDFSKKVKKRPPDEFKNKIVIIGSTAPSLFDIKITPLSQTHPGVEILATAMDNIKHGDYLHYPEARVIYMLLSLLMVWLTAWGFFRNSGRDKIDHMFGLSQFILVGISYTSINLSNTYINLTGPVMIGMAYFTIARIYASGTRTALERNMVRISQASSGNLLATVLLIRLDDTRNIMTDVTLERIRRGLEMASKEPKCVDVIKGLQTGGWDLFGRTFAVSWVVSSDDAVGISRIKHDVEVVLAALMPLLRKNLAHPENVSEWFMHQGIIAGGVEASARWRAIYAEAILRWEEQKGGN
jgi:adenylate cyclase